MDLKNLEDAELLTRIKDLVRKEREDTAEIIAHLAEIDSRDLALRLAFPSLFAYCIRELGYSDSAAYYRIRAARTVRRFPQVLNMIKTGAIGLEAIVRLHPHLNAPDAVKLLESAQGKSIREIESMVAGLAPLPDKPDMARMIAVRKKAPVSRQAPKEPIFHTTPDVPERLPAPDSLEPATPPTAAPSQPGTPPEVKRVHFAFTAEEDTLLLLRRAQELLRHKYPAGRFEDIFRDALLALLEKRDPDLKLLGKLPKGMLLNRTPR
ncbi:MAG: hypothetical protein WC881_05705 [Elusimicrobiota bacterium]|jgi:hypothetical protein